MLKLARLTSIGKHRYRFCSGKQPDEEEAISAFNSQFEKIAAKYKATQNEYFSSYLIYQNNFANERTRLPLSV